jgi:hypothetical protein
MNNQLTIFALIHLTSTSISSLLCKRNIAYFKNTPNTTRYPTPVAILLTSQPASLHHFILLLIVHSCQIQSHYQFYLKTFQVFPLTLQNHRNPPS